MADWTSDATEALNLSLGQLTYPVSLNGGTDVWALVRSRQDTENLAEDESYENFHPSFTYPVCSAILLPRARLMPCRYMERRRKSMGIMTSLLM
jgi:hypothetical protein